MMKEFGVKFECKNSDEEIKEHDLQEHDIFYSFSLADLEQPQNIDDLIVEFSYFRNIYVAKESESIFEPKEDDLGLANSKKGSYVTKRINKLTGQGFFDVWDNKDAQNVKIIMRSHKHFFDAEVEDE